jgi:hypothetical protein
MIVNLYSVFDKVSGVHDGPVPMKGDGQATRAFGDQVRKEGSPLNLHPEDFVLMRLGTWNDATGEVVGYEAGPQKIASATDFNNVVKIEEAGNA